MLVAGVVMALTARAQSEIKVTESNPGNAIHLTEAPIVVADEEMEVVKTVAGCLAEDIELVAGKKPATGNTLPASGQVVVAGTVGTSPLIRQLVSAGKLDVSDVEGKWEAYGLQVVENPYDGVESALVVYGGTPRGTAYGLFEISKLAGVSPWVWWADVKPQSKGDLYASGEKTLVGEPSVKYRGIFINDEDFGIQPWAAKGLDKQYNNIGPNTYAKVMELLLRLRANTLWPAMHLCSEAFWANKANLPVAKKYDIMLGSSHCEQMLRDNEWEWRHAPWNGNDDNWNYVTNKATVQRYWEERVAESVGYDAMYTVGMRGVHDWGIGGYPTTQDKVRGLTEIIAFQRSLLDKYMGDATKVPQLFIPYKEVMDAYNAGLQVQDDITICWVDDNHGYIRQMPNASEQARSGGNGIYYHVSYWGTPADYLWLCSHSPSLISYELSKAYDQGIRTLWVINVGDIKPAELELEFSMDLAWDINSWTPEKASEYARYWFAKYFGEDVADEIAAIKAEYYRLAASGRPEHIFVVSYSDEEMDQRIADYAAIAEQVDAVKGSIPAELLDAYYQLVEYPVKAAYNMNIKQFRANQSLTLAKAGEREMALEYAADARKAYRTIQDLTVKYNTGIAGGKWNGMMDYKPRGMGYGQFDMPQTATASDISSVVSELPLVPEATLIAGADYSSASASVKKIDGLGTSSYAATIWPLDMTKYDAANAPYVEYDVPVKAGQNTITVRCLPTFPINTSYDLRVAVSIDGAAPVTTSLKTIAMEGKWNTTIPRGYNDATAEYESAEDKTIKVRVALMDPGVVVNDIKVTQPEIEDLELTEKLIANYDFELRKDGTQNPEGNIDRGIPAGWSSKGTLNKGANGLDSYGLNQDASNFHGKNVCWINSQPMPEDFWLYQTIPADKIEPGVYKVSCMLWVENSKKTNCRLFANNYVQYYGYESDYTNLLTAGEINSYAGYAGGTTDNIVLRDMDVYVVVEPGEDLSIGIKTSNRRNDGSKATDNAGWFKVDYFRIQRVSGVPTYNEEDLTLTEKVLKNYDFELFESNGRVGENTSGETKRYTPYGWNIVGNFPGQSYGINNDAKNPHKTNVCWCLPQGGHFPEGFELYQTVPASELTPGRYLVQCKLWVEEGYLATTRLFANKNVQYYGMETDYINNLTEGENNTFAGYIGYSNGNFVLSDMYVYVDLAEGEDLRLGIRADGRRSDGTMHPEEKNGWFKVDYFRINKVGDSDSSFIPTLPEATCDEQGEMVIYDLQGRRVKAGSLQKGIYIVNGRKVVL